MGEIRAIKNPRGNLVANTCFCKQKKENMESNIKINLLINKPKYTANLSENNFRVYTTGEAITEQKDFMR